MLGSSSSRQQNEYVFVIRHCHLKLGGETLSTKVLLYVFLLVSFLSFPLFTLHTGGERRVRGTFYCHTPIDTSNETFSKGGDERRARSPLKLTWQSKCEKIFLFFIFFISFFSKKVLKFDLRFPLYPHSRPVCVCKVHWSVLLGVIKFWGYSSGGAGQYNPLFVSASASRTNCQSEIGRGGGVSINSHFASSLISIFFFLIWSVFFQFCYWHCVNNIFPLLSLDLSSFFYFFFFFILLQLLTISLAPLFIAMETLSLSHTLLRHEMRER